MTSTDAGPHSRLPETDLDHGRVVGEFVTANDDEAYVIRNVDRMPAFLMSIVSDADHWMYLSSLGGLTAGRVSPDRSLFPYETDDRLYSAAGRTGPFTLLRLLLDDGTTALWQPLAERGDRTDLERNLYKSLSGNWVEFEEHAHDLGLTFSYRWNTSGTYGFVRTATLRRRYDSTVRRVDVLDGLLNVMPADVPLGLQQASSTLVEAYRRTEVDPKTGLAVFSLESRITDRAEPAESMFANVAWSVGLDDPVVALTLDQVPRFRTGMPVEAERLTRGTKAHYLVGASIDLSGRDAASWMIGADVHRSQLEIQSLRAQLLRSADLPERVAQSVAAGTTHLRELVDSVDGSQCTADRMAVAHHFANTLFNSMRGGVFVEHGAVPVEDFREFLHIRNRPAHRAHDAWLAALGDRIDLAEFSRRAEERGDADLIRLAYEYLPLTFSRRHGDPSRPWNMFAIRVRDDAGNRVLDYQGNWRDIFQNWEALCYSYPSYVESIVAKFVNASTVDGYNPYRITRQGIDWETPDPHDAWSNIGYWGDHQIVYLLRLLEASAAFHPGALHRLLNRPLFSYGDVPYRLRPYEALVRDGKATIEFDERHNHDIEERTAIIGSDGKLVLGPDHSVHHVTLAEKLLVAALAKLANLVVDGGIWMNTQRPEWNDANNALVGIGASMVTLAYLRRYLEFCERLFSTDPTAEYALSAEVADWLNETRRILTTYRDRLQQPHVNDRRRKRLLDALGSAFSDYRSRVYEHGFSGRANISTDAILELCRVGRAYAEHSLQAGRRESGLYHAYNLIRFSEDGRELNVDHLPEMLEGQVAALSSGFLTSHDVLHVIDALYDSSLYRPDQDSFMLYPIVQLPSFLDRNVIDPADVDGSALMRHLVATGDGSLVQRDAFDRYRFAPSIGSEDDLGAALDQLSANPVLTDLVAGSRSDVHGVFERVFRHEQFTGRSGSMYKYEGLGSIYWHMVSKLLLAVQESYWTARTAGESDAVLERLAAAYYRVRAGLSSDKTPLQYGAFPMDPYSHTPAHMGAQQPGMTGQVKEEILTRWGELGVRIRAGAVHFDPVLLRRREFVDGELPWTFVGRDGHYQTISLPPGSLGFTFCHVPIVYRLTDGERYVETTAVDGGTKRSSGLSVDHATSQSVFAREGSIAMIEVGFPASTVTIA